MNSVIKTETHNILHILIVFYRVFIQRRIHHLFIQDAQFCKVVQPYSSLLFISIPRLRNDDFAVDEMIDSVEQLPVGKAMLFCKCPFTFQSPMSASFDQKKYYLFRIIIISISLVCFVFEQHHNTQQRIPRLIQTELTSTPFVTSNFNGSKGISSEFAKPSLSKLTLASVRKITKYTSRLDIYLSIEC